MTTLYAQKILSRTLHVTGDAAAWTGAAIAFVILACASFQPFERWVEAHGYSVLAPLMDFIGRLLS